MKTYRILNLGAGVQSTALYILAMTQDEPTDVPPFDLAIFADTQDEPAAVYGHLEWLKTLGGPPIRVVTAGRLGDALLRGMDGRGGRFASIPAFFRNDDGDTMIQTRQCTEVFKIREIERAIRRDVLGLKPGSRVPAGVHVEQVMGLSFEEPRRIVKVQDRFRGKLGFSVRFPLWDMQWKRADCLAYLADVHPGRSIPRSACTFCPYRSNAEWRRLRSEDSEGWARAVEIDGAMRDGARAAEGFDGTIYLHRSCKPLAEAPIDEPDGLFDGVAERECEGVCGT